MSRRRSPTEAWLPGPSQGPNAPRATSAHCASAARRAAALMQLGAGERRVLDETWKAPGTAALHGRPETTKARPPQPLSCLLEAREGLRRTGLLKKKPGGDLLSHAVSRGVPSALEGLTSVFGMGTGVTPPI